MDKFTGAILAQGSHFSKAWGTFSLLAAGYPIGGMKTCSEIRHENLLHLIDRAGSIQAVAEAIGKDHAQVSQLKLQTKHSKTGKPRTIGDDTARLLEEKFNLEVGWMDHQHGAKPTAITHRVALPFGITLQQYEALNEYDRGQIEGFIKGLLHRSPQRARRNGTTDGTD